jgi:RNA polymerase sigma-70 factor (ECF subfamily)
LHAAKNLAIDVLRRQALFRDKEAEITRQLEEDMGTGAPDDLHDNELKDDQLRMMFACCHPVLSREAQVALTLKTLCGFDVTEIARAFLIEEPTIAQRLVRAKRRLREERISFKVPEAAELAARLEAVLEVLYLLFNEGYNAHVGEDLIRHDLCDEAIRLTALLADHPVGNRPKVHALLALMLLQASRLPARVDTGGNLLLLSEQDRSLWDQALIQRGLYHLSQAGQGDELTEYHLQAGIAACHAMSPSYESTDWKCILSFYDTLVSMNHSPVVALNRAVALAMLEGPETGIEALEKIKSLPPMKSYYLFPATLAEFYAQMGNRQRAAECYRQALALAGTEPERRFLLKKREECEVFVRPQSLVEEIVIPEESFSNQAQC